MCLQHATINSSTKLLSGPLKREQKKHGVFPLHLCLLLYFLNNWDTCHMHSPLGCRTPVRKRGETMWRKTNEANKDNCQSSRQVAQHDLATVNVIDILLTSKTDTHTHKHTHTGSCYYLYSLITITHLFTCPLMPARKMSCISIVPLGRVCH